MKWVYLMKALIYGCVFLCFDDVKLNIGGLLLAMVMLAFFIVDSIEEKIDKINKDSNQ